MDDILRWIQEEEEYSFVKCRRILLTYLKQRLIRSALFVGHIPVSSFIMTAVSFLHQRSARSITRNSETYDRTPYILLQTNPSIPTHLVSVRGPILKLPPEILLQISIYLSPVARMALSYTCRRISACLDLDPKIALACSSNEKSTRRWRLIVLYLLNRDGLFGPGKAVCKKCFWVHDEAAFELVEVRKGKWESGWNWACGNCKMGQEGGVGILDD